MEKKQKSELENKRRKRVGSLNARGGILTEMGKVFREARRGELNAQEAKALASILQGMAQVVKDGEAEEVLKQIEALRAQLDGKPQDDDETQNTRVIPPPFKQIASH